MVLRSGHVSGNSWRGGLKPSAFVASVYVLKIKLIDFNNVINSVLKVVVSNYDRILLKINKK